MAAVTAARLVQALDKGCAEEDCAVAIGLEVDAHVECCRRRMQVLHACRRARHLARAEALPDVLRGGAVCVRRLHDAHLAQHPIRVMDPP